MLGKQNRQFRIFERGCGLFKMTQKDHI